MYVWRVAPILLIASLASAQSFEVATLKVSPPPKGNEIDINIGTARNGRVTLTNATLSDCLKFAYGLVSDAQLSRPDWINSGAVRFGIDGRAPADTPRDQLLLMLRTLLTERLRLVVRREDRELSFLALAVGKGGPKFSASRPDPEARARNVTFGGRISGVQLTMSTLAGLLSRFERQTIVDRTGLRDSYDLKLEWSLSPGAAHATGPSIYTALQEELGLKLESRKGPLDLLVVDHAEKNPRGEFTACWRARLGKRTSLPSRDREGAVSGNCENTLAVLRSVDVSARPVLSAVDLPFLAACQLASIGLPIR
jgi:uncharacterized protein (TIGR03435 family)